MKPTLVVLAAGLGSRYGSLKQMDRFGPSGETIVDYAIYDAIQAGFEKIVFVIRKQFEREFKEIFEPKIIDRVQVEYAYQELNMLPGNYVVPDNREKPWGTAHAVLMAAEQVSEPFAIVNADDFYGRSSLQKIHAHLSNIDNDSIAACLIGFVLRNTLSDHGRVSRGVCKVNSRNALMEIIERTHIFKENDDNTFYLEDGKKWKLNGDEIVSMNLMGFTSKVFDLIERLFVDFLENQSYDLKSEFFIPSVLDEVRRMGCQIPVLRSEEQWFGVTYKEDKVLAQMELSELVDHEIYPRNLWN